MQIQPGQTYRSADPRGGPRIRIERYTLGHDHAWVVDAQDSKRARWVLVRSLHATATTKNGTPRRTGYVLEQPATVRDAARQATGQTTGVPCGVCGNPWTDTHGYSGDCQTTGQDDPGPTPVGRCTVMLQGGGRCEKRADHRPPGSDDPHTPEPAPAVGQPAEAQGADRAADITWIVEKRGDTDWLVASTHYDGREKALNRLARRREQYPDTEFRLVRETTTWTVEDER